VTVPDSNRRTSPPPAPEQREHVRVRAKRVLIFTNLKPFPISVHIVLTDRGRSRGWHFTMSSRTSPEPASAMNYRRKLMVEA
jgi:hypothetical protein